MKLEDFSIIAWLHKNGIKTETGKPYDLRSHLFWYDVLRDESPLQVWLKAAQVGGTLAAVFKLFYTQHKKKINAIYTMPTDGDVRDFVSGKVNPLIAQNPILQSYITDKDSVEQKRIGQNTTFFRGTWTQRAALSISSDLNIYDEEDRSNRLIIDQYASRLQHSDYKMEWHFSNPSSEGNGVSRYWNESDQKHWFVTCSKCTKKQFLSWPENVCFERKQFICKFCKKVLSEEDRRVGDWHAKKFAVQPKFSGYWISLLMAPWITAEHLIELNRTKSREYFDNFVLGLPYIGPGNKITEDEFFANLSSKEYKAADQIVIGLDTGLPIWYVIGNKEGLFYAGSCDGYSDLERLLNKWPKSIIVSDQGGDLIGIRELQEKYPGRVYLCHYRTDRKTMNLITWGKGQETGNVVADRNRVIQLVMDELKQKRIPLLGTKEDWFETWTHFANVYRTVTEDVLGQEKHIWERSGPDHLLHAINYWRIGMDKFGFYGMNHIVSPPILHFQPEPATFVFPNSGTGTRLSVQTEQHDWRNV